MHELKRMMENREKQLRRWLGELERRSKNAPSGSLRVRQWGKRIQYFLYQRENISANSKGSTEGLVQRERYLGKDQISLIRRLGQRDYDRKAMILIEKELKAIKEYKENRLLCVEDLFDTLSEGRRHVVRPLVLTEEQYLEEWKGRRNRDHKPFPEDSPVYLTAKRERVRSKSEVLIADTLDRHGIPYLYEYPLDLGRRTIYPDFTIPDPLLRQDIYFEHLGMMDSGFYGSDVVDRLGLYRMNGIFPGRRLILSFESSRNPLNVVQIEELIRQYLPWYLEEDVENR